jgi:hypothetical protein
MLSPPPEWKESLWDVGPPRNMVYNGPTYQMNRFLSTAAITYSFRIRPEKGLRKLINFMVPSHYLVT